MAERVRRPFWVHQLVEYLIGLALISASVQLPEPALPAAMGLVVLFNAAVAEGGAGAFRLVGRRMHRWLDLVVIVSLVVAAVQPWVPVDASGRLLLLAVAFMMLFVWFLTDYDPSTRAERRAGRASSEDVSRSAGRIVGQGVNSVRRWKDGLGGEQ
jgi:hypothetical protein